MNAMRNDNVFDFAAIRTEIERKPGGGDGPERRAIIFAMMAAIGSRLAEGTNATALDQLYRTLLEIGSPEDRAAYDAARSIVQDCFAPFLRDE